jgi:periplasmic protein TonB
MVKDVKFFGASISAHVVVIAALLLLSGFHAQEEEVVLTLDFSEPTQQTEQKIEQVQTPQKTQPPMQKTVENSTPTPLPTPAITEKQVAQTSTQQAVVSKVQSNPIQQKVDVEKEYLDFHLQAIRKLLSENRRYPRNARVLGQEGDVEVSFRLNSDGSVEDISIVKSSTFDVLDNAARELIASTAKLFPKPPKSVRVRVPLKYALQ